MTAKRILLLALIADSGDEADAFLRFVDRPGFDLASLAEDFDLHFARALHCSCLQLRAAGCSGSVAHRGLTVKLEFLELYCAIVWTPLQTCL